MVANNEHLVCVKPCTNASHGLLLSSQSHCQMNITTDEKPEVQRGYITCSRSIIIKTKKLQNFWSIQGKMPKCIEY